MVVPESMQSFMVTAQLPPSVVEVMRARLQLAYQHQEQEQEQGQGQGQGQEGSRASMSELVVHEAVLSFAKKELHRLLVEQFKVEVPVFIFEGGCVESTSTLH